MNVDLYLALVLILHIIIYPAINLLINIPFYFACYMCNVLLISLETIHKYSRLVERLGFDENFVDVTELVKTYPWSEKFNHPLPEFVLSHPTEGIKMTRNKNAFQ